MKHVVIVTILLNKELELPLLLGICHAVLVATRFYLIVLSGSQSAPGICDAASTAASAHRSLISKTRLRTLTRV
jgi:hypothetical protein